MISYVPKAKLETVEITGGTGISSSAFSGCTSLTSVSIGNGVTSIGDYAFSGCTSLTSMSIGNEVTSIGSSAFYNCDSLTSVYITDLAKWCEIDFGGFYANPLRYAKNFYLNGELVTELVIPEGVTSIRDYAFYGCTSLTSITIPDSVTSIGDYAFRGCTSLTSVSIGNGVTSIGDYAFYNCPIKIARISTNVISYVPKDKLETVEITGGSSIDYYAFGSCSSLTSVTIGNSVTSIGEKAFYNSSCLKSITIGNGVTCIGTWAFAHCTSLSSVTIPDSVSDIGEWAFFCCDSLESITIPFVGGSRLASGYSLHFGYIFGCTKSNSFSSGYHYYDSFERCYYTYNIPSSLKNVSFGDGVTRIHSRAFYNCTFLTGVNISDIAKWCEIIFDDEYANPLYYAKNLYLNGELVTELVIPEGVTSICASSFRNCESLTSITVPNSVTRIGGAAFQGCSSVTSITIPDSIVSIGNNAFQSCDALTSVHISNIAKWCEISFGNGIANPLYYAHNLYLNEKLVTDLVIPEDITSIGDYAFFCCLPLKSVIIHDNIEIIGDYAFEFCDSLTSVTIGNGVTSIGDYAFAYSSLPSIILPTNVTSVGDWAFAYCEMTSIEIPNSVTSIGNKVFYGCIGLKTIYYRGTRDSWEVIQIGTGIDNLTGTTVICDCGAHILGEWEEIDPASCNEKGSDRRDCTRCDYYETKDIEALGHDMSAATCTKASKCKRNGCNHMVGTALGHDMSSATCTEASKCKRAGCNHTVGAALGHNFVNYASNNNATCNADGTKTATCERCTETETVTDIGTKLNHSFVNYINDNNATCTADGTKTAKCERCTVTDTITETNSKLGHNMGAWSQTSAPNCTEKGAERRDCAKCDHYETREVAALGHEMSNATCTEASKCKRSDCNHTVGSALGHNFVNYVYNNDATCTVDGTKTAKCERCTVTDTVTDEESKLGHDMSAATCTTASKCKRDGCNHTVGIALGHSWTNATCTAPKTCSRCSATGGSALGHDMSSATCTEVSKCKRDGCNHTVGTALGHSWNGGVVTEEPTTEKLGKKLFTCTVCSATKTEDIPKLTFVVGDLDGSNEITSADAVYLLMNTFFPEDYPITDAQKQESDFDGDGEVNSGDAVYLLMYTFFPEDYPLRNTQPAITPASALIPTKVSVKKEDEEI